MAVIERVLWQHLEDLPGQSASLVEWHQHLDGWPGFQNFQSRYLKLTRNHATAVDCATQCGLGCPRKVVTHAPNDLVAVCPEREEKPYPLKRQDTLIYSVNRPVLHKDICSALGITHRESKRAFCYLLTPPLAGLTKEARQRLKAIEEFADLGSGFNIAMRDLDIRGAGNLLGAEQSGFISEIGFEMYHRILDEAIQELKENEFRDVFEQKVNGSYVKECQLETDMELLIPDHYITNIRERLSLYKELDSIENEELLMEFQEKLIDRFGPLPGQVGGLMNAIRLRWLAKRAGFEKIVLKDQRLTAYFISNQESPYYRSEVFSSILRFVQANPGRCRMKEARDKLSLSFDKVPTVFDALELLKRLTGD